METLFELRRRRAPRSRQQRLATRGDRHGDAQRDGIVHLHRDVEQYFLAARSKDEVQPAAT